MLDKPGRHPNAAYTISTSALLVLLEHAQGRMMHQGWCFTAGDEEDLERQLPHDEVESCPVCDAVFKIQQQMRSDDRNRGKHIEEVRDYFFRPSQA